MENPNLKDLLVDHPPPWTFETIGEEWLVYDARRYCLQTGQNFEARDRFVWTGLVEAVNVSSDYLEVLADLLEESAELAAADELADQAAEQCQPVAS